MRNNKFKRAVRNAVLLWVCVYGVFVNASELQKIDCSGVYSEQPDFELTHDEIAITVAYDFSEGEFKALIDSAENWRDGRCILKDGSTQIDSWLAGFTQYFHIEKDWEKSLEQIEKFKSAYPDHVLPALAESRYWSDFANNARGFGYASTVSEQGWVLFKERLLKSEKILLDAKRMGKDWPQWYWQLIRVQSLLGRPKEQVNKVFMKGTKIFNNMLPIYTEMSYYLEPRWRGSWDEVDKIVDYAVANVKTDTPAAIYTRMYWERGQLLSPDTNFFDDTKVSWSKMKEGFQSLEELYPSSLWVKNGFIGYACLAGDKKAFLSLRDKVKWLNIKAWPPGTDPKRCDARFLNLRSAK